MVTLPQLRDAGLGGLDRAVADWTAFATALDGLAHQAVAGVGVPLRASGWKGADAEAAARGVAERGDLVLVAAQEARYVVTVLDAAADDLRGARNRLLALLDAAVVGGLRVADDGRVEAVVGAAPGAEDRRRAMERSLAAVIGEATATDGRCAAALAALYPSATGTADWLDTTADGARVTALRGAHAFDVPKNNPAAAARWWSTLTEPDRQMYLAMHPAAIGALDGLPTDVRDRANRITLAETKAALLAELKTTRAKRDAAGRTQDAKLRFRVTALKDRLTAIQSLEQSLNSAEDMWLLGFNPKGDGRAIVAIGNPDKATHTAVYIPGTGSDLASMRDDISRMQNLTAASRRYAKASELSTIAWVGYDAPDTLLEAITSSSAHTAAPTLKSFVRGVGVAQGIDSNSHITLIAHSYGSVVVGEAAYSGRDMPIQDIIVAGSPGMHVDKASDLNIGSKHVWAAAAPDDVVPVLGSGAHAPLVSGSKGRRRATPDERAFGANRIRTDGAEGHSEYWESDEPMSLDNQAAIITGRYEDVSLIWGSSP
ncbi:alpha/beta hydrolase [Streptomyces sp. SID3343]|uniref:alpha/beta hydrolase n=1 Tax=Streptomyces sp. SID3343 TaxID=2690260 RepID=UPI00136D829B|nr:alpha/beta hydrolase [Streptomyces sp. SID3343]MYV96862.1 hypothetical protein [Streptomyces sp. SID3343]